MANVDPSLHVLCLSELEWSQLQMKLIGTSASHGWPFGGRSGSLKDSKDPKKGYGLHV